jgi:hypothetical protein
VPNLADSSPPHRDAIALGEAVRRLDALELGLPDDWDPVSDMGDMRDACVPAIVAALAHETVVAANGVRWLKTRVSALIVKYAVLGGAPDWEMEKPRRDVVRVNGAAKWFRLVKRWEGDAGGNPDLGSWHDVEVDGYDPKRRRAFPDAYRKYTLDPDPTLAVQGRIEWEAWRAALDWLVVDAGDAMNEIRLRPCVRPARPWEAASREQVVWPDVTEPPVEKVAARTKRERKANTNLTAPVA